MTPFKAEIIITIDDYRRYYFYELSISLAFYIAVTALGAVDFPRYLNGEMLHTIYMFILPLIGLAATAAAIFILASRSARRAGIADGITNWHFESEQYTITADGSGDSRAFKYKDAKSFVRAKHDYFITQPGGLLHIIHAGELDEAGKASLERCFGRSHKFVMKRHRTTALSLLLIAPMAVVMVVTALIYLR